MKVAIEISPTKTGHSVRGIGSYTQNLIREFKKGEWGNVSFDFFDNPVSPPSADIIHYPYFDFFSHSLPINSKSGRVVTVHDAIPLVFPKHFPRGVRGNINFLLQKRALKSCAAVICDSKASKQDIIEKLSISKEKIHVVYLAPGKNFRQLNDLPRLSRVSNKYKLPKNFVLYVGDVNWSKNIPNLLQATKLSGANLVMVGKAVADERLVETRQINQLIGKFGLKNKIIKTGFVSEDELVNIYNLASLTIIPSFYEGFGLPLLESMACGTPVVCSDVASLSEIGKGVAIFCNPHDPVDISNKINGSIGIKARKKDFGQKLLKHVARFTWEKTAKETMHVYRKVLM